MVYEIKKKNSKFSREEIKNELGIKGFETDFEATYISVIMSYSPYNRIQSSPQGLALGNKRFTTLIEDLTKR